jgi:MFS family permease
MIKLTLPRRPFGALPSRVRKSLDASLLDGYLWAMMFGLGEGFVVPFAIYFKASALLLSLINGLAQMSISVSNILGAHFIQYYRKRKTLAIITNILHASSYLFLFWMTLATKDPAVVPIFFVAGLMATSLAGSGWFTWMNDLVPPKFRGRFWGLRNKYINIFVIVAGLLAGAIMTMAKRFDLTLWGFGLLFCGAFVFRLASFIPLMRQHEPPMKPAPEKEKLSFFAFLFELPKSNFGRFAIFNTIFTFSTSMMPALTTLYLLKTMKVSYIEFSIINISFTLALGLLMPYWGKVTDTYGNYRVFTFAAVGILLLPLGWIFFRSVPVFILLNLVGGFFWSGFSLSSQNFILDNLKKSSLHYHFSYYNAINNFSAFLGAVTGGLLAQSVLAIPADGFLFIKFTDMKLEIVFFISFLLRLAAVIFFVRTFSEIRKRKPVTNPVYVFMIQPALEYLNPVRFVSTAAEQYVRGVRTFRRILIPPEEPADGSPDRGSVRNTRQSRKRSGPPRPSL